jgi:Domain of unknown function (DUF5667)
VAAAMLVLGGTAGIWSASAAALPGSPLYGAKVGIERLQLLTAFTPAQQVSVHLSVASARLQEADAETGVGNRAEGEYLIQAYDGEIAQAQAILLSQANAPGSDSLLAQSDWELVMLQEGRQRLVSSTLAPAVPSGVPNVAPSAGNLVVANPTVSPDDPSKLQRTQADIGLGGNNPADNSVTTAPAPGIVGVSGGVGVASVAVGPADVSTDTSNAATVSVTDRLDRLVRILLTQASAGDSVSAGTTAQEFALDVKAELADGTLSIDRLMYDRSRLEAALGVAPTSTQGALLLALNAIYDAVPGSRPLSAAAASSVTAPATPLAPAPVDSSSPSSTAPVVIPTPIPGRAPAQSAPKQISSGQTPTGQQQSGGGPRPVPVPVITAPKLPSPMIPKPIIVRDPNHLPSPSLTGRKPLTIAQKQPVK